MSESRKSGGRIGVLFVCLGNICRSPLAEGVFRGLVREVGLEDRFDVDSAGTSNYHRGEAPDPRTIETAARRGVKLTHASRQITGEDLHRFEYVMVMDAQNLAKVRRLADSVRPETEVRLLREYDPEASLAGAGRAAGRDGPAVPAELEVPDPYFGGPEGFERVQEIVERSCLGLLEHIREEHGL